MATTAQKVQAARLAMIDNGVAEAAEATAMGMSNGEVGYCEMMKNSPHTADAWIPFLSANSRTTVEDGKAWGRAESDFNEWLKDN